MKSRFHDAAHAELTEAVMYYDRKASGLGDRFVAEVKEATRFIEQHPEIAPIIQDGVRAKGPRALSLQSSVRCRTKRAIHA